MLAAEGCSPMMSDDVSVMRDQPGQCSTTCLAGHGRGLHAPWRFRNLLRVPSTARKSARGHTSSDDVVKQVDGAHLALEGVHGRADARVLRGLGLPHRAGVQAVHALHAALSGPQQHILNSRP